MGKYSFSDDQDKRREERRPKPKPRKPIVRKVDSAINSKLRGLINTNENKFVQNQAAEDFAALQKFFKDAAKVIEDNPKCWECNTFIPKAYYRAATAHILPKNPNSGFPSVAAHPMNYLVLGAGCGCHNKTHRLDTFSKMKIFPEAVERFWQFYPLITEKHKLLDEFIMYANQLKTEKNV
jgi:hypothetical protein